MAGARGLGPRDEKVPCAGALPAAPRCSCCPYPPQASLPGPNAVALRRLLASRWGASDPHPPAGEAERREAAALHCGAGARPSWRRAGTPRRRAGTGRLCGCRAARGAGRCTGRGTAACSLRVPVGRSLSAFPRASARPRPSRGGRAPRGGSAGSEGPRPAPAAGLGGSGGPDRVRIERLGASGRLGRVAGAKRTAPSWQKDGGSSVTRDVPSWPNSTSVAS